MSLAQETEMTSEELDEFLGRKETGVLALSQTDEPYAIPISYGYDADTRTFYMRLVSTPQSQKRKFLDSSPAVRLVVYEEAEAKTTYLSVVVSGSLEEISPEELTVEQIEQYGAAKRPLFEIWGESRENLDIQLYELNPDNVSGRRIKISRKQERQD